MATKKITGAKTVVQRGELGAPITTPGAIAGSELGWYRIDAQDDTSSTLPTALKPGMIFKNVATELTLTGTDAVTPVDLTYVCHSTVDFSAEEGVVEVTDSCSDGYNENILDGFVTLSGTINSFIRFIDGGTDSGALNGNADNILGRFMDKIEDDSTGASGFTYTAKDNSVVILFICLNKDAAVGEWQNFLVVPANITSAGGIGGGIKDALSQDMAWTKGEGHASYYKRKALAGDVF